jgi:hypothetical protein
VGLRLLYTRTEEQCDATSKRVKRYQGYLDTFLFTTSGMYRTRMGTMSCH